MGVQRGRDDPCRLPQALRLCEAIASRLGVAGFVHEGYEDPWRFVQEEAALPLDVDPHSADLRDPEERRRLERVLARGLQAPAGFARPPAGSRSERWEFRRGRLYLIVGDAPVGLRLPLVSLGPGPPPPPPPEEPFEPPDPRGPEAAEQARQKEEQRLARLVGEGKVQSAYGTISPARSPQRASPPPPAPVTAVRTALCVEPPAGALHVFIPPVATPEEFLRIVAAGGQSRRARPRPRAGQPPPRPPEVPASSAPPRAGGPADAL